VGWAHFRFLNGLFLTDSLFSYLNLGTIFRWVQSEIDEIFMAVRLLNQRRPGGRGVRFLWKLPRGNFDLSAVPSQVKFFEWLQDPLVVYEHSAVKACINHGGMFSQQCPEIA
jgi:hypothetical protein